MQFNLLLHTMGQFWLQRQNKRCLTVIRLWQVPKFSLPLFGRLLHIRGVINYEEISWIYQSPLSVGKVNRGLASVQALWYRSMDKWFQLMLSIKMSTFAYIPWKPKHMNILRRTEEQTFSFKIKHIWVTATHLTLDISVFWKSCAKITALLIWNPNEIWRVPVQKHF